MIKNERKIISQHCVFLQQLLLAEDISPLRHSAVSGPLLQDRSLWPLLLSAPQPSHHCLCPVLTASAPPSSRQQPRPSLPAPASQSDRYCTFHLCPSHRHFWYSGGCDVIPQNYKMKVEQKCLCSWLILPLLNIPLRSDFGSKRELPCCARFGGGKGGLRDGGGVRRLRSPCSPQILQKYTYMWNNSYKTPTECW